MIYLILEEHILGSDIIDVYAYVPFIQLFDVFKKKFTAFTDREKYIVTMEFLNISNY